MWSRHPLEVPESHFLLFLCLALCLGGIFLPSRIW